jgi:hypothetical protein
MRPDRSLWIIALLFLGMAGARGVIFRGTDDPAHNTTPPDGSLTNSGWQCQGRWGAFLGTPISPRHFIAAAHVGGAVGDTFMFRGVAYSTTAMFDDPNSDLRIWRVCGLLPEYAVLYDDVSEVGKPLVVFGRGTQRGAPLIVSDLFGAATKGWLWGTADGVQRWGTNVVSAILNGDTTLPLGGAVGGPVGDLLQATFDANGGADEAHLSVGDSSGGLFIQEQGVWKLAGINYGVEAYFNTNDIGPGFFAAITDKGGLYSGGPGNWQQTPELPADLSTAFYATRIASNLPWIRTILNAQPPAQPLPQIESASAVTGPYEPETNSTVDGSTRTIILPQPTQTRFFRLNACDSIRIARISANGTNLVLNYE